jgi:hypothetical protein
MVMLFACRARDLEIAAYILPMTRAKISTALILKIHSLSLAARHAAA